MKLLLLASLCATQAMGSPRLSKKAIEIFRPLTVKRVAVDNREQLARVVNNFQLEVMFTRLSYQRQLSKADDVIERTDLRSKWQEWAVTTKEQLRELAESRQHLIDKDILAELNAIDSELQRAYVINLP